MACDEDDPSSTLLLTLEKLLVVEAAILPLSCWRGPAELDCNDDAILDMDVAPSGVMGRKLPLLELSATEFTRAAATEDSVGVIEAVLLLVLAELPLLLPDPVFLI